MGVLICLDCAKQNTFRDSLCPSCGRFLITDRPLEFQRARGKAPWSLVVVLASILGAVALIFIPFKPFIALSQSKRDAARLDTSVAEPIARTWIVNHPTAACPTFEHLIKERLIPYASKSEDPWGTPYAIDCQGGQRVLILSAGPDRQLGTADDLTSRDYWRARGLD